MDKGQSVKYDQLKNILNNIIRCVNFRASDQLNGVPPVVKWGEMLRLLGREYPSNGIQEVKNPLVIFVSVRAPVNVRDRQKSCYGQF